MIHKTDIVFLCVLCVYIACMYVIILHKIYESVAPRAKKNFVHYINISAFDPTTSLIDIFLIRAQKLHT